MGRHSVDQSKLALVEGECCEPGNILGVVDCDVIPCNVTNLESWYEPGKFVPIPDVIEVPVFRSMGSRVLGCSGTVVRARYAIQREVGAWPLPLRMH